MISEFPIFGKKNTKKKETQNERIFLTSILHHPIVRKKISYVSISKYLDLVHEDMI